ncbi:uncharacterized protein LOC141666511 isoform X4 [Apium graveolens]|uniref:uncharacterized protein LOC141666511 isoform X4 n=1 Tax=Apium graveolens TaxID=4045 RepID=UPI003D7B54CF
MEKLIEFGRRAMFYARVLSGYEERRIRSYRLQIQQRLAKAEEKKSALKKIPEQIILSEVRRMVEEMQSLNKKLEETEAAIDQYFSPLDKEAEMIVKMQLEGEEKTMKEMVNTMQRHAMLEKEEAEKIANVRDADAKQLIQNESSRDPPGVAK